ncbi:hypothetical protein NDU88_007356 [Pleurodeles waltl]|uniref:Uncharacterized protein n=1 Tax=Pleurodeles waltl TaxID=8319 RepID=A0AAV7PLL3_PLEWA|nr:hypothetical protein NDU88_007356 [Pleurodeles waltl]
MLLISITVYATVRLPQSTEESGNSRAEKARIEDKRQDKADMTLNFYYSVMDEDFMCIEQFFLVVGVSVPLASVLPENAVGSEVLCHTLVVLGKALQENSVLLMEIKTFDGRCGT